MLIKKINVLSLFDGISCGQVALERAGMDVHAYFASEVDDVAISITHKNYPNTLQVGDVCNIEVGDYQDIDLLIGGSPCQSFSFASSMDGMVTKEKLEITTLADYLNYKNKGYEFEGQSYLFWEYVRVL
ncbi:MAG TPA: DNA cytosine methyltransferase, partial [Tissierellaceae bacterium]|nr:DNA cytosine methyltransferase [Tissierellaceae bacterium]